MGAESTFRMYFKVLENNVSSADHHDLLVEDEDLLIYDGDLQNNDRRGNLTFGRKNV